MATAALGGPGISKTIPTVVLVAMCAFGLLASACGQSTSSAQAPTPAAVASAAPVPSPPPGGPVPAQLLGDWFLTPAAVDALIGCPKPLKAGTACLLRLSLTATTYRFGGTLPPGPGDVIVNATEIDFFNAPQCDQKLPDGIGRYTWTLTGGVLHLTPLNADPCGRSEYLTSQDFYRTP